MYEEILCYALALDLGELDDVTDEFIKAEKPQMRLVDLSKYVNVQNLGLREPSRYDYIWDLLRGENPIEFHEVLHALNLVLQEHTYRAMAFACNEFTTEFAGDYEYLLNGGW